MAKRKPPAEPDDSSSGASSEQGGLVGLKIFVTLAGAVLMALEMVGSRLLAPHFGNSVFVWGSLIGVFLAALSAGYFVGGIIADRDPSPARLAAISIGSALLMLVIPSVGHPICRLVSEAGMGERSGPLVAAGILFLPASVLIGMVSPFSVRIAARSVATVGRAAGSLYALSTLGSIAGTLLTTFVLVPHFGVTWILRSLGITMLLLPLALVGSIRRRGAVSGNVVTGAIIIGAIGLFLPAAPAAELERGEVVVLDVDTPYHHIRVTDFQEGRIRALRFDRFVESSIDLAPPYQSMSEYTDYFHLAFILRPAMSKVLFIGTGGGIGPRTFHETDPGLVIDVVDIDAEVLRIARDYFHMPDVPALRTFAKDGRMFAQASAGGYDCIVLDAFTIGGRIPFHLATREAFALYRDKLAPGGVFIMNTNSSLGGPKGEIFAAIGKTSRTVFPEVQAFAGGWRFDTSAERSREIIFVATRDGDAPSPDTWRDLGRRFVPRSSVSRQRMNDVVADLMPTWPDVSKAPLLTDECAPIETMGF